MIRLFLIPLLVFLHLFSTAQAPTGNVRTCRDSIVVRKAPDGSLYLLWKAGYGTEVQTMAAAVGYSVREIEALNPILKFRDLEACDLLMTPVRADQITRDQGAGSYPIWYEIRAGETAFNVARRMLDMPVEQLLEINQMTESALREGQPILAGWLKAENSVTEDTEPDVITTRWHYTADESMDSLSEISAAEQHLMTQKGVAWWNKSKPDPNFFALHRYAPMNSYIEIRNPMFDRTVKAKVIGTIPPTYPEDISVIVSEGVARELGAIDTRFHAEMSYALD